MKVVVKFVRPNGMFVVGDITQLDIDEAKKEESRHNVVLLEELKDETASGDYLDDVPEPSKEDKLICPICGKKFKSEAGVKVHKLKVHAIK